MSRFTIAAIAAAALSMSACGDNSPTTPTPTPPASVTDTFSGTLTRNGATTFPFNVSGVGTVYLTLTAVADSSSTVDRDRLEAFTTATWVTVRLVQPVYAGKPGDVLGCAAVIGIAAPRFNDRLNVRTEGEIVYHVIRRTDGSFMVEVPFKELSDLANRAAKPLRQSSL